MPILSELTSMYSEAGFKGMGAHPIPMSPNTIVMGTPEPCENELWIARGASLTCVWRRENTPSTQRERRRAGDEGHPTSYELAASDR